MKQENSMTGEVDVYIPQGWPSEVLKGDMGIRPGSGIVGQATRDGAIEIYYEGNLNGAENLRNYAERCYCAAGRMKERYPTVAHRVVPADTLRKIGSLDLRTGVVRLDVEVEEVAVWVADVRDARELRAPSVMAHLEHKLGSAIMRHPERYQRVLARLGTVREEDRAAIITQEALSLGED
jgi:hypothetical protein